MIACRPGGDGSLAPCRAPAPLSACRPRPATLASRSTSGTSANRALGPAGFPGPAHRRPGGRHFDGRGRRGRHPGEMPLGIRIAFWAVLLGWNVLKWQIWGFALLVRRPRDWPRTAAIGATSTQPAAADRDIAGAAPVRHRLRNHPGAHPVTKALAIRWRDLPRPAHRRGHRPPDDAQPPLPSQPRSQRSRLMRLRSIAPA